MYTFILQTILMLGLGTMIFIIGRAAPRIDDNIKEPAINKLERWFASLPFDKIDAVFNNFLEKTLRRIKLITLKLDNAVNNYLGKIKKKGVLIQSNINRNGNGEKPTLFNAESAETSTELLNTPSIDGNKEEAQE